METQVKLTYESPAVHVIQWQSEGLICQSDLTGDRNVYPGFEI